MKASQYLWHKHIVWSQVQNWMVSSRPTKSKWAEKPQDLYDSERLSYQQLTKDNIKWLSAGHLHPPVTRDVLYTQQIC